MDSIPSGSIRYWDRQYLKNKVANNSNSTNSNNTVSYILQLSTSTNNFIMTSLVAKFII